MFVYLANGLFTPAWYILLVQQGNGIDQFGLLLGLIAFGSIITAYSVGWLSHYRNPMTVLGAVIVLQGLIMAAYAGVPSLKIMYFLQFLYGAVSTAIITLEQILISQYSEGKSRSIGKYNALMHGTIGVAMIIGGISAGLIGAPMTIAISSLLLLILGCGVLIF